MLFVGKSSVMCTSRFCSRNYHPFSTKDPKKYVVDDDYTPAYEASVPFGGEYSINLSLCFIPQFKLYIMRLEMHVHVDPLQ